MRPPQSLLFSRPEQPQLTLPDFIGDMLQLSHHLCGSPLDSSQQVLVLLVLRTPELDTARQVGSNGGRTTYLDLLAMLL